MATMGAQISQTDLSSCLIGSPSRFHFPRSVLLEMFGIDTGLLVFQSIGYTQLCIGSHAYPLAELYSPLHKLLRQALAFALYECLAPTAQTFRKAEQTAPTSGSKGV